MNNYTPTTEQVRRNYVEGMNAFYGDRGEEDYREQFDRWLAAHDAEVRAGFVAEEPEWEYGVTHVELPGTVFGWLPGDRPVTHRRRKAGPWVPVKQGGAGHEGDG